MRCCYLGLYCKDLLQKFTQQGNSEVCLCNTLLPLTSTERTKREY